MAYLFVHFREMWTEKGEQVYFALSKNGYDWEIINDGNPVITAKKGDLGVRDIVIARTRDNRFVIMATDLALIKNIDTKYKGNIRNAFKDGSKAIAMWKSDDLVNCQMKYCYNLMTIISDAFGLREYSLTMRVENMWFIGHLLTKMMIIAGWLYTIV